MLSAGYVRCLHKYVIFGFDQLIDAAERICVDELQRYKHSHKLSSTLPSWCYLISFFLVPDYTPGHSRILLCLFYRGTQGAKCQVARQSPERVVKDSYPFLFHVVLSLPNSPTQ
jgi:hypothetical protein